MHAEKTNLRNLFAQVSNWGRWGADDQAGTLNLIGPAQRLRALSTVTDGVTVSCSRDIVKTASEYNTNPAQWALTLGGDVAPAEGVGVATDRLTISPHGGTFTHLDALCHVAFDGQTYNGFPVSDVTTTGIASNDMSAMVDGILARGVLLDIPALRGTDYVAIDAPIGPADLDAAEREFGVSVEAGDILVLNVGREARVRAEGPGCERIDGQTTLAGMTAECLPWLRERDVAVLMSDGGSDALPRRTPYLPIHVGALVFLGLPLIDNACLERLASYARRAGRWEFALTLAPLRCFGTTGIAINPIALF